MARALKKLSAEQEKILKLSSTLPPLYDCDKWSEIDNMREDLEERCCDGWSYNRSYSANFTWRDTSTLVALQTCGEYLVLRYYYADCSIHSYYPDCNRYYCNEVAQRWIDKEGNITLLAIDLWHKQCMYFKRNHEFKVRPVDAEEYRELQNTAVAMMNNTNLAEWYPLILSDKKVYDCIFGEDKEHRDTFFLDSFKIGKLMYTPLGETLYKAYPKVFKLFTEGIDAGQALEVLKQERQFRIALRGKFEFTKENFTTWLDYAKMLEINLPNCAYQRTYLCPQDLDHAHDWITRINNRRIERINAEQARKRAEATAKSFIKHHKNFLNIILKDDKLTLHSLDAPVEYLEEGKAMHHCVGMYADKANSLIFSCRNEQGERVATIEVRISDLSIIQVRGVCNADVKEDKEIRDIINNNLDVIKERKMLQSKIA